jgi:nucleoside-diphosphate-sugar epimerase
MKILLTGHLGFIGSALYNELIKEHTVIGIDIKDGKDLLTCDLNYTCGSGDTFGWI